MAVWLTSDRNIDSWLSISSLPEFADFRVDKFNLLKTVLKFLSRKRITQSVVELVQRNQLSGYILRHKCLHLFLILQS
ncbi:hypothetical protein [Nostoc sp.]|uniref:hypothetical protein n=1 Tax=Nostoc sp. TaxID=1180 RepID=UPI002FF9393F